MLEIGERTALDIVSYGSEGQGIGRHEGMTVFVPNAIRGESVLVEIEKRMPSYATGRMVELIKPSPERVTPECAEYSRCGGCNIMHASYGHQLEIKRERVADALARIGGFRDVEVMPCVGADEPFRCRNKAVFSFAQKGKNVVSGCLQEKSHNVIEINDCIIQKKTAVDALRTITEWANEHAIPAYNEKTGVGILRNVIIRTTSLEETMAVIVSKKRIGHTEALAEKLKAAVPTLKSLINNINAEKNGLIMGRRSEVILGGATINERIGGLYFAVGAQSFLQVNSAQTLRLYSAAIDALELKNTDDVIDLYCGVGTISLLMAKQAGSVTGIEAVPEAIEDARRNAERNGINNAEFICGNAEKVLPSIVKGSRHISKLLLDPPRRGALRPALDAIIKSGVERIAYVSCDPATLARDLKILAQHGGYKIASVRPFDMFPQTAHVETVVLLSRT